MAEPVRLAEVLAALAAGTDLGMGQPPGHAARTCLIATAVAGELGLEPAERADVFHVGLLRYLGCTADAEEVARFAGDELELAVAVAPFVMGDAQDEERAVGRADVAAAKAAALTAHCEAAALMAGRLGLGEGVVAALQHGFERWDGTGSPAGMAGTEIPVATRVAVVARDLDVWQRRAGWATTREVLRERRGRAYDPAVVDDVLAWGGRLPDADDPEEALLAADPWPVRVPDADLDRLLEVMADFADVKLGRALGHSRAVARTAERAAHELGLEPATALRLRRAGLVHDLGRVGVSTRIWAKPGALTRDETERVQLHPYLTERILARPPALRPLARLAGAHHERRDGSGYHRGAADPDLDREQRVLAAADVWSALLQERPHRPALDPDAATAVLTEEVRAGRLDARAVAAVAGIPFARLPTAWPAGLTDREVEVLRLACRGTSREVVAGRLGISPKTVSRHLEHAYLKIGVTTRAGAALYAVAHGLLDS
jgi:HD-GYP domain-containing protein (c-di-GMP phosphodiesterase class II)